MASVGHPVIRFLLSDALRLGENEPYGYIFVLFSGLFSTCMQRKMPHYEDKKNVFSAERKIIRLRLKCV